MKIKEAEIYLPCYRAGQSAGKRILKAAQLAGQDEGLKATLEAQVRFDQEVVDLIHSIQPPEDLRKKLGAVIGLDPSKAPRPLRSQLSHPAMVCVVAGALLMIGFLVWLELDRRADFKGRAAVAQMVGVARDMSGVELQPVDSVAGDLGDSFYIRGFEGFSLVPELARLHTVGTRVFKQDGHPVAQLAVDPHNALLYLFRASDFGIDLHPHGKWKVFTVDGFVIGLRQDAQLCAAISFRGTREEMESFLRTLTHE